MYDVAVDPNTRELILGKSFQCHMGKILLHSLNVNKDKINQVNIISNKKETHGSVRFRSICVAQTLLAKDMQVGDIVMICASSHNDACIPFIASMLIGVMSINVAVGMSHTEIKHLISLANPKFIFTDLEMVKIFEQVLKIFNINATIVIFGERKNLNHDTFDDYCNPCGVEDLFKCEEFDTDTTAAVGVCSSGTTGLPKIISITHKALILQLLLPYMYLRETFLSLPKVRGEGFLNFSPMFWISGVFSILSSCMSGQVRYHAPKPFSPELFERGLLYKPGQTMINTVEANQLLKYDKFESLNMSSLSMIFIGGGALNHEMMLKLKKQIPNGIIGISFGSTESGSISTGIRYERGSVGKIGRWWQWKVVDVNTEERLGPNKEGELRIKSLALFREYYGDSESTKLAFDSEKYYKTGDLVYYDIDGFFYYVDRCKGVFKYNGYQVSTIYLENKINSIPGVFASCVVRADHPHYGEIPLAFVQKTLDAFLNAQQVKDVIRNVISECTSEYKEAIVAVVFIKKLPLTHSRKINRKKLNVMKLTARWE